MVTAPDKADDRHPDENSSGDSRFDTDRWVPLEGGLNVRDLGGLPTVDGRTTRSGVLLRSGTLQNLTATATRQLVDGYGLRCVLDLRTPRESEQEGRGPLAAEPVEYHNLPFITDDVLHRRPSDQHVLTQDVERDARVRHYLTYLKYASDRIVTAVDLLAVPQRRPALFHCAAGKDRTGVLAALVLDAVGVRHEAIVTDYALSARYTKLIVATLSGRPTYAASVSEQPRGSVETYPETMAGFLQQLDAEHGGAAAWLTANGLPAERLAALRAALVA
jgi:protein tyrosine/serine phosphatase